MGRVVGVLQQRVPPPGLGYAESAPGLVVDSRGHVWRWVEHAAAQVGAGWVEVETYVPRESGDSIPAGVCPECQESPCIGHPRAAEPPLLNKSGGSDVVGECPCMANPHFSGGPLCRCPCHPNNR